MSDQTQSKQSVYSRLKGRIVGRTDQRGVTLQEVLIGIAVAAVLAASAIFLGARFIGTGQFSSAQSNLQTATLAVEQIYAQVGEGGARNYAAAKISTGTLNCTSSATTTVIEYPAVTDIATATDAAECLSDIAALELNALGESVNFVPYEDGAAAACNANHVCSSTASGNPTADSIQALDSNDVWVQVLPKSGTTFPGEGQVIRLGVKAESGATACVVVVKRGPSADLGRGYQSATATNSATDGGVADCDMGGTTATSGALMTGGTSGQAKANTTNYDESLVDPG